MLSSPARASHKHYLPFLPRALSRSGKKVLHLDRYGYYGGADAGLSLQDAAAWAEDVRKNGHTVFRDPQIATIESQKQGPTLGSPRSYILGLNPQIIYAQSAFLPSLVSSQIHTQLEFLAVGAWWVYRDNRLHKIPGSREDVFNDQGLSRKDKVGLMKFLRFVLQDEEEEEPDEDEQRQQETLQAALVETFRIPTHLQAPLLALALSNNPASRTSFGIAVRRIRRHMRSVGYFGPGFGAVVAKYAGNAEIAQVACRAGAVGGGVYLLGHGIAHIDLATSNTSPSHPDEEDSNDLVDIRLSDGIHVKARHVVSGPDDIPQTDATTTSESEWTNPAMLCSISIIANELKHLFPQTADNGPTPAVALVLVEEDDNEERHSSPIYLQIHSEDTGECPSGQCVIYGSTVYVDESSNSRMQKSIKSVVDTAGTELSAAILWSMSYIRAERNLEAETRGTAKTTNVEQVSIFGARRHDIVLDDNILDDVKAVWTKILGPEAAEHTFMRFEEREQPPDME